MNSPKKHFVTFLSPGTFFNEVSEKEFPNYNPNTPEKNIAEAVELARTIRERHGARPYAFYFTTKELQGNGWEQKAVQTFRSNTYLLNAGTVLTLEQVKARNNPKDSILISNMEINDFASIMELHMGGCIPINADDVLLNYTL